MTSESNGAAEGDELHANSPARQRSEWRTRLDDEHAPLFPVGMVADLLCVSPQVIRRFDAIVATERSEGGQRRYSRADIAVLERALDLADSGYPLEGIERLLDLEGQVDSLSERIDDLEAELGQG